MCTDLEFEIAYRQKLINSPAIYRLSKVQAELESEGASDSFQENMSLIYMALYEVGLSLSFPEEEFRDYDERMMIVSRAEIRDALSADHEVVATGRGFSVIENIGALGSFSTCDFNHFNNMILKTRKSALSGLFAQLFPSEEVEEQPADEVLETTSSLDYESGDFELDLDENCQERIEALEKLGMVVYQY